MIITCDLKIASFQICYTELSAAPSQKKLLAAYIVGATVASLAWQALLKL